MKSHVTRGLASRGLASVGVVGLGAGGLLAALGGAAPAVAFTGTCPTTAPAATLVADNVCEVRFTAPGTSTFTVPSGVTKLSAVLVGAGGGAQSTNQGQFSLEYAGGGGAVVYLDSVSGSSVTVAVGAGGLAQNGFDAPAATAGGDTKVGSATAGGGQPGAGGDPIQPGNSGVGTGGTSGTTTANGPEICELYDDPTFDQTHRNAGGARADAQLPCSPGAGYQVAQLTGLDPALWPAASLETTAYGVGGAIDLATSLGTNAGAGGSVAVVDDAVTSASGSNGLVILRFAPPKPTLAATGFDVDAAVPGLAALALAGGAVLLGLARRRSRRA